MKNIFEKLFPKLFKKKSKLSFLETHDYRIRANDACYFIEIKGGKYPSWTGINKVLNDRNISPIYNGHEIKHCVVGKKRAVEHLNRFCEYIVEWECGNIEPETLEGNLKEFYVIENL